MSKAEIPQGGIATLLAMIESSLGLQPTLNRRKKKRKKKTIRKHEHLLT